MGPSEPMFRLPGRRPHYPTPPSRVSGPQKVPLAGGDVQGSLIGITEGAVGRAFHSNGHRVSFQHPASRGPYVKHGSGPANPVTSGAYDITFGVQAHAIYTTLRPPMVLTKLVKNYILTQSTII